MRRGASLRVVASLVLAATACVEQEPSQPSAEDMEVIPLLDALWCHYVEDEEDAGHRAAEMSLMAALAKEESEDEER